MVKFLVFLFGFILFQSFSLFAQNSTKEIDQLIRKGKEFSLADRSDKAIEVGAEIIKRSIEIKYSSGIIRGNTLLAYEFRMIGDYGRSLVYANNVWKQFKDSVNSDPKLKATLLFLIGHNYLEMGLKKEAIQIGRKFLSMTAELKDSGEAYNYRRAGYGMIYSCYKNENHDSVYYYLMKAKYWDDAIERLKYPTSKFLNKTTLLFSIANYYIDYTTNYDSAYYYINKGMERRGNELAIPYKTDQLIGKILFKQGQYQKALSHLVLAINDAKKKRKSNEIITIYKLMSQVYTNLGDREREQEFQKKALIIADSVQNARRASIQTSIELVKSELENDIQIKHRVTVRYIGASITVFIFALGGFLFVRIRRVTKKAQLATTLKMINNDGFREVVDLAKKNDPAFLGRFKEVYPLFCKELVDRYSNILSSELVFFAYLKLNFTTKDIAAYTYVTPSAVRNRKNRMKKKFGIPAHIDIYAWIDKITD